MPVCRSTSAMKSPPFSASRVALVALAMISSTLWVSASRRNFARVWSARGHRRRRQAAAVEAAGAEPNHVFFAIDDLEGEIGPDFHHDHVDGVRSNVDGGYAHAWSGGSSRPAAWPCACRDTCRRYILAERSTDRCA